MDEKKFIAALFVIGAAINIYNMVSADSEPKQSVEATTYIKQSNLKQSVSETVYTIPSDPYGKYKFLKMSAMDLNLMVVTERTGKGGSVTYSTREIDCDAKTFRYLAEGDTLEQMQSRIGTTKDQMGPLTEESISSYIAGHACDVMHDKGGYKYRTTS